MNHVLFHPYAFLQLHNSKYLSIKELFLEQNITTKIIDHHKKNKIRMLNDEFINKIKKA